MSVHVCVYVRVSGFSSFANAEGTVLSDVTSPLRDLFVCVTPRCLGIIAGRITHDTLHLQDID